MGGDTTNRGSTDGRLVLASETSDTGFVIGYDDQRLNRIRNFQARLEIRGLQGDVVWYDRDHLDRTSRTGDSVAVWNPIDVITSSRPSEREYDGEYLRSELTETLHYRISDIDRETAQDWAETVAERVEQVLGHDAYQNHIDGDARDAL